MQLPGWVDLGIWSCNWIRITLEAMNHNLDRFKLKLCLQMLGSWLEVARGNEKYAVRSLQPHFCILRRALLHLRVTPHIEVCLAEIVQGLPL
jgi:hypothetical protein